MAIKSDSLSWEEAVAIPFGANTALYYLWDLGKIQAGKALLIMTDMVRILWTSITGGKKIKGGVAVENLERMNFIVELAAAGKLKPVIDRSYPSEQIAEAFKYVE